MQAYRTWLFVPAKEKYYDKIGALTADAIILDLEDSLTAEQKDSGMRLAFEIVKRYGKERDIYVRINSGERMDEELKFFAPCGFSGYMIPKFEDVNIVQKYQETIGSKEVIALIESLKGVVLLENIAGHPLVNRLAFGGEDFCRELGFGAGQEATLWARGKMVLYAAYHNKYSLDTINLEICDMEKFMLSYQQAKKMGFSGKLLIHPRQVEAVRCYEQGVDKEHLKHIVDEFKSSTEGVVRIDGQFYEKPHIDKIETYLRRLED